MIIGITGTIGSGKTFLLNILHELGYTTYSADLIVKESYQDKNIICEINKEFSCIENGKINKDILKSKLNDKNIIILNNIIHPFVINKIKEINNMIKDKFVFIEIPLLFEENLEYLCSKVVTITTDSKIRDIRLYNRDKSNYEKMKMLEKLQLTDEIKIQKADFVIINNFDKENILKQVQNLIDYLNQ